MNIWDILIITVVAGILIYGFAGRRRRGCGCGSDAACGRCSGTLYAGSPGVSCGSNSAAPCSGSPCDPFPGSSDVSRGSGSGDPRCSCAICNRN